MFGGVEGLVDGMVGSGDGSCVVGMGFDMAVRSGTVGNNARTLVEGMRGWVELVGFGFGGKAMNVMSFGKAVKVMGDVTVGNDSNGGGMRVRSKGGVDYGAWGVDDVGRMGVISMKGIMERMKRVVGVMRGVMRGVGMMGFWSMIGVVMGFMERMFRGHNEVWVGMKVDDGRIREWGMGVGFVMTVMDGQQWV